MRGHLLLPVLLLCAGPAVADDDVLASKPTCTPPCATGERCTPKGECVRPKDDDEPQGQAAPPRREPATPPEPAKYVPSIVRMYVGPMLVGAATNGSTFLVDPGGTFAADFHVDRARVVFVGFRAGGWGDPVGAAVFFDVDLGLRPRLWTSADDAVGLAVGGGVGLADFIDSSALAFHLPMRVGPYFDFGTFTLEVVGGPALYVARSAIGAFEGEAEIGVRFGR